MSTLVIPSHIATANLASPVIRYVWQDWRELSIYRTTAEDDLLLHRLDELSYRATLALTIAAIEWVVYRYKGLADIDMHLNYVEAAWAAVVDDRYLRPWEPTEAECSGPLKGPLACALMIIQEAVQATAQEGEGGLPVIYASNLAERVLPGADVLKAFRLWCDDAISRLMLHARRDHRDTLGDVVVREFFDAQENSQQIASLMRRFMDGLDAQANPHLHSCEELDELHLDGVPYTFDLQFDRQERRNN